jgi:hypothetical protein
MMTRGILILATAILMLTAAPAMAGETDKEAALKAGAVQLTAEQIAERIAGKTGLFLIGGGDKRVMIYYGEDNELAAKPVDSDSLLSGFYAVTDRDNVCMGWKKKDLPRLRCMDVLLLDGVVYKYNTDGSLNGVYENFEDGKIL